ncbi:M10 family metallopeptidase [Pseudomonas sp. St316]|uniref:M10 family metallopeptidase n=1 Tax=Pseudomonas sp. St316 TaxID=2678257 RepID=UPI001BB3DBCC|nr:M10 family metallopeptidase [Pseudomonas sp. St316]BBP59509.1 hypothetical protein PHLH4_30990 [Pseudomonas sp. St316]
MPTPVGYSFSSSATLTGNAQVDSLLAGTYWMGNTWSTGTFTTPLTYSFITENSRFSSIYSSENEYEAGYVLTSAQQSGITSALSMWSSVANIKFTQVSESTANVGDLRFGGYLDMDSDTAAWGYFPADTPSGGDVWLGPVTNNPTPDKGTYDYLVFMHEIGHALGLKHPFSQNLSNATVLASQFDDVSNTIMSYNTSYSYEPTTPMLLDIAAIQSLYGANTQWQTGNNTYSWGASQSVFETIWDAGGTDTIDASNQLAAVSINLNEGQFSKIGQTFLKLDTQTAFNEGLAIAYGAKIENAVGSANDDSLIGNALANVLDGRAGNDTLIGGIGNDTMIGGTGNDIYVVDNIGDVVSETSTLASEIDAVRSSVSWSLGANLENLILTDTAHVNATGNTLGNVLVGNVGNNVLNGLGGADILIGGAGNDIYVVDNLGDVVSETSTLVSEIDAVSSSVSWSLGANLENLILTGTAHINAAGNTLGNVLVGNAGDNVLNGLGGADILNGGAGNDIYVVDNVGDVVSETSTLASEIDAVSSSVSWSLGANLENLILTGTAHINAAGNTLGNVLVGNAGNNVLNGLGGADIMNGGAGNDIYVVDNVGDVVSETSTLASEIDAVSSSVSWSLGANLENLILTGTAHINAVGNTLDNVLVGNAGNNVLNGLGGADIMNGGAGNDIYVVDNVGDVVSETSTLASEIDAVSSSVSWSLGANLENLILTGTAHINATGNDLGNVLAGNTGNNVLNGGAGQDTLIGGIGTDTLIGGVGADRFVFSALNELSIGSGRDVIFDFSSLEGDKIDLSKFDANVLTATLNKFSFIDSNEFTTAGQLRFVDHILYGNVNGDLGADFEIQLVGVNTLNATDLIA